MADISTVLTETQTSISHHSDKHIKYFNFIALQTNITLWCQKCDAFTQKCNCKNITVEYIKC